MKGGGHDGHDGAFSSKRPVLVPGLPNPGQASGAAGTDHQRHCRHALYLLSLGNLLLRGQSAKGRDDDPNAVAMPALDRFMIRPQQLGQTPPGKEVPAADRVNKRAAADDAAT